MASDAQPMTRLNLASRTALAPSDRRGALVDSLESTVPADQGQRFDRHRGVDWATTGVRPASASRSLGTSLRLVDVTALGLSWVFLGYVLWQVPSAQRPAPGLVGGAVTWMAMRAAGLYRSRRCARPGEQLARIALASIGGGGAFVVAQTQFGSPDWQAAACTGASITVVAGSRWLYTRVLRERRAEGRYLRRVLLVGSNEDAVDLHTMFRSEPELGYAVAGVVAEGAVDPSLAALPSGTSAADLGVLAAETGASGVVVVPCAVSSRTVAQVISAAVGLGLHVQVWPGIRGVGSGRLRSVPVSGEPFFYVEPRTSSRWQLAVKRVIDVVGAAAALAVTAPLLGVIAVLVKLEDGGPVLFRGERIGRHGKPFRPLKIRSMTRCEEPAVDALADLNERTDGPLFKSSADPRVTKIGHFLRASSLDEVPQLWNVLRGTMSLVGPRPALPQEVAQFDPELQRRHSVRPGITGLWQVEARHNPSFHAYRRLDLRYVDNWSLALDLSIMMATVPAVFSQTFRALRQCRRKHS